MATKKNSIKNPLPHGEATFSSNYYDYHNQFITIHPDYNWVKYVAYIIDCDKSGERATRAGYFRNLYNNPKAKATNICTWNALSAAGYIKWDNDYKTYRPTKISFELMDLVKKFF